MVLRICTLPTSRRPRVLTTIIRSWPQSLVIAEPLRPSPTPVFLRACILISSSFRSGGALAGSISQFIGRRLTIILFVMLSGIFIPLWILPSGFGALAAGAFCVQFGVQGAWGVIPIQLAEMSPPGFRATFPGVAYQLGNVRGYTLVCSLFIDWPTTLFRVIDDIRGIGADRGDRRGPHENYDHCGREGESRS